MKITQIYFCDNQTEIGLRAAHVLAEAINENEVLVLGLPTGKTPLPMYEQLVRLRKQGKVDFSNATAFNLDEYVGLNSEHSASYSSYMKKHFYNKVNFDPCRTYIPDGSADNLKQECERYEERIKSAGGIDLIVLGIGVNGHIGFNEPGTSFDSRTHIVKLSAETRSINRRFFENPGQMPEYAITMGIQTIMEARRVIVLASGTDKAQAVRKAVEEQVSEQVPASVLKCHPNAEWIIDQQAASQIDTLNVIDSEKHNKI